MTVTLCSIFRNSAHYLRRYFDQVDTLRKVVDLRVVGTWGDSDDNTLDLLRGRDMELYEYHHGGPNFGSVDHGPRWDQIAKVVRFTLDKVGEPGDALIWVEADLIWKPLTMLELLDDLAVRPIGAVAPMVYATDSDPFMPGERFYDTWGFRRQGKMFNPYPPYADVVGFQYGLVKIDSCGSCFVTREDHWREWSGHWPYTAGDDLWLDPTLKVRHP